MIEQLLLLLLPPTLGVIGSELLLGDSDVVFVETTSKSEIPFVVTDSAGAGAAVVSL